jgi:hypothetical protein
MADEAAGRASTSVDGVTDSALTGQQQADSGTAAAPVPPGTGAGGSSAAPPSARDSGAASSAGAAAPAAVAAAAADGERSSGRAGGGTLTALMHQLSSTLGAEQRQLDAARAAFEEQCAAFERERRLLAETGGKVSSSDMIDLNVGGRLLTTTRRTLCTVPDSLLATMFRWGRAKGLAAPMHLPR